MARINLNPGRYSKRASATCKPYPSYNYSNTDAVEKLTRYITDSQKTNPDFIYYYNVPSTGPQAVQDSFSAIRKLFGKDHGRHAEHFVISLNKEESIMLGQKGISNIAREYCSSFAKEYQVVCAVHLEKPEQLHFHVEINPVSFRTGKRLHKDAKFLYAQRTCVDALVQQEMKNIKS